jgi:hypothetical protein
MMTSAKRRVGSTNCTWLGRDGGQVLAHDRLGRSPSLGHVALHPPDEAEVVVDVEIDGQVEQFSQVGVVQHENPVDDDHRSGVGRLGDRRPGVGGEVVHRQPRPQRPIANG